MAAFLMLLRLPIANCRLQARNDKGKQEKLVDPLIAAAAAKG